MEAYIAHAFADGADHVTADVTDRRAVTIL